MKLLNTIALTTAALICFAAAPTRAGEPSLCHEMTASTPYNLPLDAGGFSRTTGEQLDEGAVYLVAHVERPDGRPHPAFGPFVRGIYVFRTTSGRLLVRIMDLPEGHGWYGPY